MGMPHISHWHSIFHNALEAPKKFGFNAGTGYFGFCNFKNPKKQALRTITSDNPKKDAEELFRCLIEGANQIPPKTSNQILYLLNGEVTISLRTITSTRNSPAVEISFNEKASNSSVKKQKIHFIKKGAK